MTGGSGDVDGFLSWVALWWLFVCCTGFAVGNCGSGDFVV